MLAELIKMSATHVNRKGARNIQESQILTQRVSFKPIFESTRVLGDLKPSIYQNDNKCINCICNVSLACAGGEGCGSLNPIDPHEQNLMEKGRDTPSPLRLDMEPHILLTLIFRKP